MEPEIEHDRYHDPATRDGGEDYDPSVEFADFEEPRPMTGDSPLEEDQS